MPKSDDILVQLATRVPRELHREIKLHCVANGLSVMDFVAEALTTKLKVERRRSPRDSKRS
jgi:predicted HicB family RNase H-like nuclease